MMFSNVRIGLRRRAGLLRSLIIYWRPGRQRALRDWYRPWLRPGEPVFDVGAHLGDRTRAFAALGARVIALEPQPLMVRWMRRLVGSRSNVLILPQAVGATAGTARLAISALNPTVSSLAQDWRGTVQRRHPGFRRVRWEETVTVPVTTLDQLVAEHGRPCFCKIDVEGFEAEVLAGLSEPLPALSFEFVAGMPDAAVACIRRLEALGEYRYNAVAGEARRFLLSQWMDADAAQAWVRGPGQVFASGDLYAKWQES